MNVYAVPCVKLHLGVKGVIEEEERGRKKREEDDEDLGISGR
jgi:hypothetical protein